VAIKKRDKNKGKRFAWFVAVGSLLIIAQLSYMLFFSQSTLVTTSEAIDKAVGKISGLDERRKELLKIQLAVEDYMSKNSGKAPKSLDLLRPEYFDIIPVDPKTRLPFSYKIEGAIPYVGYDLATELGISTKSGGAKPKTGKDSSEVAIEAREEVILASYVYDPTGKVDPFRPFDLSPKEDDLAGRTPLERYEIGQLKLTAVLGTANDATAFVENAAGKGFSVKKGTKIGLNGGTVIEIQPDKLLILESVTTFTGEKHSKTIEMKLRTKEQEKIQRQNE
jgi:type IV pilus assembly protein PilP